MSFIPRTRSREPKTMGRPEQRTKGMQGASRVRSRLCRCEPPRTARCVIATRFAASVCASSVSTVAEKRGRASRPDSAPRTRLYKSPKIGATIRSCSAFGINGNGGRSNSSSPAAADTSRPSSAATSWPVMSALGSGLATRRSGAYAERRPASRLDWCSPSRPRRQCLGATAGSRMGMACFTNTNDVRTDAGFVTRRWSLSCSTGRPLLLWSG
jgi:hypothetical protein